MASFLLSVNILGLVPFGLVFPMGDCCFGAPLFQNFFLVLRSVCCFVVGDGLGGECF